MKYLLLSLMAFSVLGVSACGHKGGLRTPTQMEIDQEKKQKKAARNAERKAKHEALLKEMQEEEGEPAASEEVAQ